MLYIKFQVLQPDYHYLFVFLQEDHGFLSSFHAILQCESHCDDLDKARVTFQYYFPLIVNNLINLDDSIHTVYNILDRSSATFRRILTPIRKEGIRGQVRLSKL